MTRLERVREAEEETLALLAPMCERLELTGESRRLCPQRLGVDLLAIPKLVDATAPGTLAKKEMPSVLKYLPGLLKQHDSRWWPRSNAFELPQLFQFEYKRKSQDLGSVIIQLRLTTAECWGWQLALRTGPPELIYRICSRVEEKSLLPAGYELVIRDEEQRTNWDTPRTLRVVELHHQGDLAVMREEREFFDLVQLPYWEPVRRSKHLLMSHLKGLTERRRVLFGDV